MPRFAPVMPIAELKTVLIDSAIRNDFEEDYEKIDPSEPDWDSIVQCLFETDDMKKVWDDWSKVDFSTENTEVDGFHLTATGVPYIWITAGGDWEDPLACIIYFDGKHFRGYIPKDGNSYNHKTKSAFGNNDTADAIELKARFNIEGESDEWATPERPVVYDAIDKRIVGRGTYTGSTKPVKSKATEKAEKQKAAEVGMDLSGPITSDMVYVVIELAAGASYFSFKLRKSGRKLTSEESRRVVGVPSKFRLTEMSDYVLWYAPSGCYPQDTYKHLVAAQFVKDPKNDISMYAGARTKVIYL